MSITNAVMFSLIGGCLLLSNESTATVIAGYDVQNAALDGTFGVWSHTYTGTITVTGFGSVKNIWDYSLGNYTSGTGTLADGIVGLDTRESQLFVTAENPAITLYLDDTYLISQISLLNFPDGNAIPGNITGLDVTIGGTTETFSTEVLNSRDEFINLSASTLSSVAASQITLFNITTTGDWSDFFAISEIALEGTVVPEPTTFSLMSIIGVGALTARRRSKRQFVPKPDDGRVELPNDPSLF